MQALWYIASRAVRNVNAGTAGADVCEAATQVLLPLLEEDIDLPSTTRMNAAYTAVSLSQQQHWGSESSKQALAAALTCAAVDDDRYVIAAAVEGLKWLRLLEIGDDETAVNAAARTLTKKLVWERFCPINSVAAPF